MPFSHRDTDSGPAGRFHWWPPRLSEYEFTPDSPGQRHYPHSAGLEADAGIANLDGIAADVQNFAGGAWFFDHIGLELSSAQSFLHEKGPGAGFLIAAIEVNRQRLPSAFEAQFSPLGDIGAQSPFAVFAENRIHLLHRQSLDRVLGIDIDRNDIHRDEDLRHVIPMTGIEIFAVFVGHRAG